MKNWQSYLWIIKLISDSVASRITMALSSKCSTSRMPRISTKKSFGGMACWMEFRRKICSLFAAEMVQFRSYGLAYVINTQAMDLPTISTKYQGIYSRNLRPLSWVFGIPCSTSANDRAGDVVRLLLPVIIFFKHKIKQRKIQQILKQPIW